MGHAESIRWAAGTRLADRFVIERQLGAGGMGKVFEAFDERRGERVAVKTLGSVDGASAYQLKNEFRALADLVHPNLVRLHELFSEDSDGCFFTMARIDGLSFLDYVGSDPGRLRRALVQLASGVAAIHAAGKIHRDIKPANVLVARDGHLTILDFGLVMAAVRAAERSVEEVTGTPPYMAPEQLVDGGACAASDWYSVGTMVYEALSGELPFAGSAQEVLAAKRAHKPPRTLPDTLKGEAADLGALAMALLRAMPQDRPKAHEILARLATAESSPSETGEAARMTFIGRRGELARLHAAYDVARHGDTKIVLVEGAAGIGKSSLVDAFAADLQRSARTSETLVLFGKCYEREWVPFKALDAVVDALSGYLRGVDSHSASRAMPRDLDELCRVFPVFGRVPVFGETPRTAVVATDPEVVRRKAFLALKDILSRIAEERPLVVAIDDLQWGDVDSALLIAHLTSPPNPPAMLLVGTYRSEDAARSPLLAKLREHAKHDGGQDIETITLAPFDEPDTAAIAVSHGASEDEARRIAFEADGSPFFAVQLAKAGATSAAASLSDALTTRIDRLSRESRALLEAVALAGCPMASRTALHAAGLAVWDDGAVPQLQSASLLRSTGAGLDTYHDRIREIVVHRLEPDSLRTLHGSLADALLATGDVVPDVLYSHCRGAGRLAEAREHAIAAAQRARDTLAFDHAAAFYRRALDIDGGSTEGNRRLTNALADALALSGHGAEAADEYLRATDGAPDADVIELERRAAGELLIRGDLARGLPLVDRLALRVGVRVPRSAVASMLAGIAIFLYFRMRGIHEPFRKNATPAAIARVEGIYGVALSMMLVDTPRALYLLARHRRRESRWRRAAYGDGARYCRDRPIVDSRGRFDDPSLVRPRGRIPAPRAESGRAPRLSRAGRGLGRIPLRQVAPCAGIVQPGGVASRAFAGPHHGARFRARPRHVAALPLGRDPRVRRSLHHPGARSAGARGPLHVECRGQRAGGARTSHAR